MKRKRLNIKGQYRLLTDKKEMESIKQDIDNGKSLDEICDDKNLVPLQVNNLLEDESTSSINKIIDAGYDYSIAFIPDEELNNLINDIEANNNNLFVECGLVAKRHKIPVGKYIFNNIADDQINQFDYLETVVNKFIEENIIFMNGKATKAIRVYVTGLSCALTSVIKVCCSRQVNLVAMHYHKESEDSLGYYVEQVIFDQFEMANNKIYELMTYIKIRSSKLYLYKCKIEDLEDTLYELRFSLTGYGSESFIAKSYEDALNKFTRISSKLYEGGKITTKHRIDIIEWDVETMQNNMLLSSQ